MLQLLSNYFLSTYLKTLIETSHFGCELFNKSVRIAPILLYIGAITEQLLSNKRKHKKRKNPNNFPRIDRYSSKVGAPTPDL